MVLGMSNQRPPIMTCLHNERGYQLYLVNGVPTVWHNWTTEKKNKDGTWTTTPHEEVFKLSEWQEADDIRASMTATYNDFFAMGGVP